MAVRHARRCEGFVRTVDRGGGGRVGGCGCGCGCGGGRGRGCGCGCCCGGDVRRTPRRMRCTGDRAARPGSVSLRLCRSRPSRSPPVTSCGVARVVAPCPARREPGAARALGPGDRGARAVPGAPEAPPVRRVTPSAGAPAVAPPAGATPSIGVRGRPSNGRDAFRVRPETSDSRCSGPGGEPLRTAVDESNLRIAQSRCSPRHRSCGG